MSTTLQADGEGALHLPASVLPNSEPLATYRLEEQNGHIVIARAEDPRKRPFWESASPEERLAALRAWLHEARTPAGLSEYAVSRDSMYD